MDPVGVLSPSVAEEQRLSKLDQLRARNIDPYPKSFPVDHSIGQVLTEYFPKKDTCEVRHVALAGRVMTKRPMGKAGFIRIADQEDSIQVYSNNALLNEEDFFVFQKTDIGDIVGISGETFRTKTNEPSVKASSYKILSKNMTMIPIVKEKDGKIFDAFSDIETRYRKRYLDLIVNPEIKQDFVKRSRLIQLMRSFLIQRGFMEVETPMLQSVASGAAAKPFETYHNTLAIPLYLRIAPELYLKRLIVGGFEKVFEINRNFRNEGISPKHNPEFTMMELYQAYSDYEDMQALTQDIFEYLALELCGSTDIPYGPGGKDTIRLKKPWKKQTYLDSIKEKTGIDFTSFLSQENPSLEEAKESIRKSGGRLKIDLSETNTFWEVVDKVFSEYVEPELIQPTIITHYPKAISPLAKNVPGDEHLVERFEPYITGREMGNAFSELNDPIEQEIRFKQQAQMKEEGAEETIPLDRDYIEALKVGMPPTGGLGLGIDRMVMLFNNKQSIKDVILFPTLRPDP